MNFPKTIGFDCNNPVCNINMFTIPIEDVSVKWIRNKGEDYIELQAECPVCHDRTWRYYDKPNDFKALFNTMVEDMFRDIDPNLPEGV